jgi:hypothetical protein
VADAIEIRRWPGLTAKRRNGFPYRQQDFLQQIVAIIARREAVDDVMNDRAVIARPLGKTLLLFSDIHEFSVM